MTKKVLFFFLTILILLGYIFKLDIIISNKVINITLDVKKIYNKIYNEVLEYTNQYLNQQENIKKLQTKLTNYKQYKTLYLVEHDELQSIQKALFSKDITLDVIPANVISYLDLSDFSKVILDTNITFDNNIYPLITSKSYSAGIVMYKDNHILSYLNPNKRANYSVFIGEFNAPAITSGADDKGNIILRHIPKWFKINIGDEVITSGMDNIFPHGIKVGKVITVKNLLSTQSAIIKPYSKVLNKNNFYIIIKKENRKIIKTIE